MLAARSVVFVFLFSLHATAQMRTLAVYPGPAEGLDTVSSHYLEVELKRILSPAGIVPVWRDSGKDAGKRLETGPLVVGSFKGTCDVDSLSLDVPSATTRKLADTSISRDRILPYFTVDCIRLIRTLAPALQPMSVPLRESILGRAMARVIAHELYHILAQTADHDDVGLAKKDLSLDELTRSRFDLSPASLRRMNSSWPISPLVPAGDLAVLSPGK
jgi:hypothetical protein